MNSDMTSIVKTMAAPDSGLDVRDRMWLKITIPNAFIGKFTGLLTPLGYLKCLSFFEKLKLQGETLHVD